MAEKAMAASCQLYLTMPAGFAGEVSLVETALAATGAPSLLLLGQGDPKRVAALAAAAHRQNVTVITDNRPMLASVKGFDGLHLPVGGASLDEARALVGQDGVVGADCHLSRHEALTLGEAGADYVAFVSGGEGLDDLAEMVEWWSGLIEIPCAAHLPADADEAAWRELVAAGADFIIPGAEIWDRPEAVLERLERLALYCREGADRADR